MARSAMRLLLLASEFPPGPGGIGTHAYEVTRHLQRLGWDVVVVTRQDYSTPHEVQQFNHTQPFQIVRLRAVPTALLEFLYRFFTTLIRLVSHKPAIIMATGRHSVWVAAVLQRIFPVRFVAIVHGSEASVGSAPERAITRWAFQAADAVVAVSQYTSRALRETGIQPRVLTVIPNGADDELFQAPTPENTGNGHHDKALPKLLTVGNVTERKGQEVVIRALPYLTPHYPNLRYDMVGLPTLQQHLDGLAQSLNVQNHIRFLGRLDRNALIEQVKACDVFVMTSRKTAAGDFEGYGIAVVEAALCAKPAVVSDSAGLAEVVVDGETGYIVPENDPQATAEKLRALLENEALCQRMGQNARQRALAEQTWKRRVNEYHDLLLSLIRS